ncbi:uncharacterized protein LOC111610929 isoform X3 [Xiphophorus maculatus]|uniref:uncharacterized protein LOC111610929 isoform X3 n=1 Tax=Xiphophorus maculatus TaxID=8083 RepID=UPI000C6CE5F7|nr:uncharacterized protein LOC111610929 isoform X3 [Xiphophorus maculatus]
MASSLPASLFLLSVVFWQFVSAADQNSIKAEPGQNVFLPCKDTDQGEIIVVEWTRTDLKSGFVLLYRDGRIDLAKQLQSYKDRMDLLVNQIQKGDASLVLKNTTIDDSGTYECRVKQTNQEKKRISTVSLVVAPPPPEPFPVWAILLLVLLVLAAAGVSFYFRHRMRSELKEQQEEKVEVESGEESVLLPWRTRESLGGDVKVEWRDSRGRTVHVYQDGSDQHGEQNQIYRTRTKMDENLLKNKDLSLTLRRPTGRDGGTYTCRVYSWKEEKLMEKKVFLQLKFQQVEVEPGAESVLLPCRTRENLDGDVKVEWRDRDNRTVHVYRNGSDQPGEQNQIYRTRTKMDENLLKTKNLSLTLRRPTRRGGGTYTCRVYNRDGDMLMEKQVQLEVKVQQVEVEEGAESVLLPFRVTSDLLGGDRVEWRDSRGRTVHVYQNGSDQPGEQKQFYRTRTKMDENLLKTKDLSLTLSRPTERDAGGYRCKVWRDGKILRRKHFFLKVKVPKVEVEPGVESVLLPCRTTENLDGDVKVEWRDEYDDVVHVYQNGSDQSEEQNQIYRTRTKMDENLLENKDLSLTLKYPADSGLFTCRVYSRDGEILMEKQVQLKVKDQQVEVEEGAESVLLPFTVTCDLLEGATVVWWDCSCRKILVYQKGSDQPVEQNQLYRTKMDKNLENGDVSLTLIRPTERDTGLYECKVWRDRKILRVKWFRLKVKAGTVQVQPEDIRTRTSSPAESIPLMADQLV